MKGNPSTINSRADYLYIKENCEPEFWKPIWQNMLDLHYYWAPTKICKTESECIVDDTHKYEKIESMEENNTVLYQQYELIENPNCDMVKYGFTEKEIKRALSE